jgi:hypothetical protein
LILALAVGPGVVPAAAQRSLGQGKQRANKLKKIPPPAQKTKIANAKNEQPNPKVATPVAPTSAGEPEATHPAKTPPNLPPQWMERLQQMPPAEQERFLNNNERFRSLPPERKAEIRRRLQEFRQLSPAEREDFRKRSEVWEKMTPEQRQRVRQQLLPKWRQMAPERRQEINRRLHELNRLSDEERSAKLKDPNFFAGLNPSEQDMLKELGNLRIAPGSGY